MNRYALHLMNLILTASLTGASVGAATISSAGGDDLRVGEAYQYLLELKPDKAILKLTGPLINALAKNNEGGRKQAARYLLLIGWAFRADENMPCAVSCAKQAMLLAPDYVEAKAFCAEWLLRTNSAQEADAIFAQLEPLQKTNSSVARAFCGRAISRNNDQEEAIVHVKDALKLDPESSRSHYLYARMLTGKEAAAEFKLASKFAPSPYIKSIYLWDAQLAEHPKPSHTTQLDEAARILPDDSMWRTRLGGVLLKRKQVHEAGKQYLAATQSPRLSIRAHNVYAAYAMFHGHEAEAKRCLEYLLKVVPHSSDAGWTLGNFYLNAKQFDKAEETFRRVLAANPKHSPSYQSLSELGSVSNNPQARRILSKEWVANCPQQPQSWLNAGIVAKSDKNWAQGIVALKQAEALGNKATQRQKSYKLLLCLTHAELGYCHYKLSQMEQALQHARIFNQTKPMPSEAVQVRPSAIDFSKLTSGSKEYQGALHGVLADMLYQAKDLDACISEYQRALAVDDNAQWHRGLLKAYMDKRDFGGALKEDFIVANDLVTRELPKAVENFKNKSFPASK